MLINANLSKEVYEYYKGYDLSQVVDKLLDMYDFMNVPAPAGERYKEVKINVDNPVYLETYKMVGPRSKKVSLGRLLTFGYTMDVLSMERFRGMKDVVLSNPALPLLRTASRKIADARMYDDSNTLRVIAEALRAYLDTIEEEENK